MCELSATLLLLKLLWTAITQGVRFSVNTNAPRWCATHQPDDAVTLPLSMNPTQPCKFATPESGVTLLELLVAMTIVLILASVALPLSKVSAQRSREVELRQQLRLMRAAETWS